MYDQVGLEVKDVDASVRFHGASLGPLGLVLRDRHDVEAVCTR